MEICKNGEYVCRGFERFENDMKVHDQHFVNSDLLDCPECGCRNATEILKFNEEKYEVTGFNNKNGCNANWQDSTGLHNCETISIYCFFDTEKNSFSSNAYFPFDRYTDSDGMTGWVCPECGCNDGIVIFTGQNVDVLSLEKNSGHYEMVSSVEIYNENYSSIGSCSAVINESRYFIGGKYHPTSIFTSKYTENICSLTQYWANSSFAFVNPICTEAEIMMEDESIINSIIVCSPENHTQMCFSIHNSGEIIRSFPKNNQLYKR